MKKRIPIWVKILAILGLLALIGFAGYMVKRHIDSQAEEIMWLEDYTSNLEWQVSAFGDVIDVYTVVNSKKSGEIFDSSDVDVMSLPSSQVTSQFITDLSTIQNCIYKIDIEPGMPLVSDIFFRDILTTTDRYYDVVSDLFPVGARLGDYYDLRIVTPNGLDYIVLSKKRVIDYYDSAVRFVLSEEEIHQYQSALVDCFLNPGTYLYFTTYVEPSMQKQATAYYPVSDIVRAVMEIDPNIIQLAESDIIAKRREAFEGGLGVSEEEATAIIAGRNAQISKLLDAAQLSIQNSTAAAPSDGSETETGKVDQTTGNLMGSTSSSTESPEDSITGSFSQTTNPNYALDSNNTGFSSAMEGEDFSMPDTSGVFGATSPEVLG